MFYRDNNKTEALRFIREFAITAGSTPIRTDTIYYVYCQWKKEKRQNRLKFIHDFGLIFKIYKKGKYRYANLSNFPEHLRTTHKEEQDFLKRSYALRNGKKKRQQENKKEKVSRIKSIR